MPDRRNQHPAIRRGVALVAALGGLLAIGASFAPWISTDTEDGGSTSISGWGGITGSSQIAGTNLNDVLDGAGTYRPGLIGLIFGVIAVICGIAIAAVNRGLRPHRITASVLSVCGLVCAGWGLFRGSSPGDAGVFEAGEASPGVGPWLTALAGIIMIVAATAVFAGIIDPPVPIDRRGIQPR
jgi:hypothetical protein